MWYRPPLLRVFPDGETWDALGVFGINETWWTGTEQKQYMFGLRGLTAELLADEREVRAVRQGGVPERTGFTGPIGRSESGESGSEGQDPACLLGRPIARRNWTGGGQIRSFKGNWILGIHDVGEVTLRERYGKARLGG